MTTPYVPYKHKTTLSTSTASSTQSRGTTPTPTASINTGFVRPPADPTPLRAPQARAAIPMGWSTSGPNSIGGGSGSGPGRVSSPSTTFGSPNGSYGRPTPPVTPNPPAMNLPFQSLSPGNSPFPPSTPRVGSPTTVSRGGGVKKAAGQGGNGTRGKGVYRSGFQPMGVRRDRTEEFMGRRKVGGEGKKLEEGRLGRRLDKVRCIIRATWGEADGRLGGSSFRCISPHLSRLHLLHRQDARLPSRPCQGLESP